jgi:hypothetical protein
MVRDGKEEVIMVKNFNLALEDKEHALVLRAVRLSGCRTHREFLVYVSELVFTLLKREGKIRFDEATKTYVRVEQPL